MADFRGYVTAAGQTFEALAKQMGYPVTIGFIEVGDGKLPDSESPIDRTQLVHKLKQFPAIVEQDAKNQGQWVATCYIPADDAINGAGYFIREIGCKLIDQGDDVLYAYRRVSDDWKPVIDSGEAKSFIYKLRFIPSNGELLTPTIDPSVVLVDKEELARVMKAHVESRNHPDASETEKGFSRHASKAEIIKPAPNEQEKKAVVTIDGLAWWASQLGASVMGYRLNEAVAAMRTVHDKLSEWASVKDFVTAGHEVTGATVQAAIDAVSFGGGGTLYIPANLGIKCTERLYGRKGVSILCEPTSWLDFRGADWITPTNDMALLGYYGSASDFIYPTSDMVVKKNKINVPNASLFKVGDMLELSMDSPGKWHDTSVVVTAGQLAIVTGVYPATNNIVISEPLYETLTVANGARIRIIDPVEDIIIDGLGMIGNGRNPNGNAEQGIKFFFGRNVKIKNCRLQAVDTQSIGVVSCYGADIDYNKIDDVPLGTVDVISYGIVYASSMHVNIRGNTGINSRHGIISSHLAKSYGYYGISRFIDIHDNTHTSNYGDLNSAGFVRSHGGIATHTDAEFVSIHDNKIIGCRFGINVRTGNNSVKNNEVHDCPVAVYLSEYWSNIEISDNEFYDCTRPFATDNEPYEVDRGTIDIHDNRTTRCGGSSFQFPLTVKSRIQFNNNNLSDPENSDSTASISVYGNCDFTADGNNFDVNDTLAIRAGGTGMQQLLGNKIRSLVPYDTAASLYVVLSKKFVVKGNTVTAPAGSISGGIACPTKLLAPTSVVTNNDFIEV
ncbi:MAG: right-handed parallel beta-helix repeat-containing protein [Aeromonas veronii]